MTGNRQLLSEVIDYKGPRSTFGDNSKGKAVSKGKITHEKIIVKDVLLVENLWYNLISIRQLCDNGHTCTVKYVADNIMLTSLREQNTYNVRWNDDNLNASTCFIALNVNKNWLWHKRLNYLNFKSLATISKLKLVSGLPNIDFAKDRICNAYQLCKHVRSTFKNKGMNSSVRFLELLHMDLFGPIPVMSLRRKKYTLEVIDDFSRFTWVIFLSSKDQTAAQLIKLLKSKNIHDLSNKLDATNLESSSDDEIDMRIMVKNVSEQYPTVHEQSHQINEPVNHHQPKIIQIDEKMMEQEDTTAQPTEANPYGRNKNHPLEQVIGNPTAPLRSRKQMIDEFMHASFISQLEPKKIDDALHDTNWIDAMQEELNQFERSKVWPLVPRPTNMNVIGTRWVFRNKLDKNGSVMRNKARLIAQGYR
ncbi:uncharacterized protein LOC142505820 [Primulina tabacum]|uniref:uncharacterized protein LOC142505820 n=1 Tax=Primulina tabacum TaxID=48773 RepID=UPI003F59074B